MGNVKEKLAQVKEYLGKFSKKTKTLALVGVIGGIAAAVIVALIMNNKNYEVLFSNISQEEGTKIVGKLQEDGVDYQYKENGDILVPDDIVDQTRANLAYEGYPKSGFTYDVFKENAGGMTTDSEKQTYKLYELQNRIGATITLFEGVKDAKVTIALTEEEKYALEDDTEEKKGPSASVVVTTDSGYELSEKQATAIQRLVSRSVQDMPMENVSVFDGNTGIEISGESEEAGTSGDAAEQIAQLIETQIAKKVMTVLAPFYGSDNIRVSAKGQVNMEKVIRESTTYTTPEKIDEEDKTGIISSESTANDTGNGGTTAGGVAGTETNADTAQYNTNTAGGTNGYTSQSATRDYLVNQVKEQGELDPGVLEDLTVSVSINGEGFGDLNQNELRELIGNATGIAQRDRQQKIAVVSAPFYEEEKKETKAEAESVMSTLVDSWPIVAIAAIIVLILIIVFVILGKRRKKRGKRDAEAEFLEEGLLNQLSAEPLDITEKPELLNLRNEKSRELRENIREFADQNPEISAQMLKTWLNGGGQDGGDGSQAE